MKILLIVFIGMILFFVLMAVGVLLGRKPISGSCGGMAAVGLEGGCDICGGDFQKCEDEKDNSNTMINDKTLYSEVK
jgi:hypothetical protein